MKPQRADGVSGAALREVLSAQLCCNRERVPMERGVRQREPRGSSFARSFGAARERCRTHTVGLALRCAAEGAHSAFFGRGLARAGPTRARAARIDRAAEGYTRSERAGSPRRRGQLSATRAAKAPVRLHVT